MPPIEGRRVQLTIDYDLQKAAEDGFRHAGFNGAALIMDPRNGEVLTYVSLPAYDPNDFAAGIDRATWASLNTDKLRPLQNRVIQGRYSPGSTFKIVVATAALEEGVVDDRLHGRTARGGANFFGRYFKCHLKGGHGTVDVRHAIEKSCNVFFYTLGNMLGVDKIHKWAEKLGMAGKTGIDLPNEQESLVPNTEWKRQRTGERWYPGETISVSIGQGQVSVTPASLAVMIATVANGGTRVTPHLVRAVDEGGGWSDGARRRRWPTRWRSGPRRWRRCTTACGWWSTPPGTGGRARIAGPRRRRQDRHGAGHLERGAAGGARHDGPRPARPRLVRVLRAEGQSRRSPASSSASTTSTATSARRSPSTSSRPTSRRRKASRCRC